MLQIKHDVFFLLFSIFFWSCLCDLYYSSCLLQPLSNKDHFVDEEHNQDYDHEAFMGREAAQEYDDLSPEESKERLG